MHFKGIGINSMKNINKFKPFYKEEKLKNSDLLSIVFNESSFKNKPLLSSSTKLIHNNFSIVDNSRDQINKTNSFEDNKNVKYLEENKNHQKTHYKNNLKKCLHNVEENETKINNINNKNQMISSIKGNIVNKIGRIGSVSSLHLKNPTITNNFLSNKNISFFNLIGDNNLEDDSEYELGSFLDHSLLIKKFKIKNRKFVQKKSKSEYNFKKYIQNDINLDEETEKKLDILNKEIEELKKEQQKIQNEKEKNLDEKIQKFKNYIKKLKKMNYKYEENRDRDSDRNLENIKYFEYNNRINKYKKSLNNSIANRNSKENYSKVIF